MSLLLVNVISPSLVVIVHLGLVAVEEFLLAGKELSVVHVECVVLVAVGGAGVAEGGGDVVDIGVKVCAVALTPRVEAGPLK